MVILVLMGVLFVYLVTCGLVALVTRLENRRTRKQFNRILKNNGMLNN